MKNISKLYIMLASLFVGLAACTQDFEEINTDPNNPTDVPASTLLTQAQFSLSNRVWSRAMNFEFGMLMVQQFAQGEYAEDSRYNQNVSTFNVSWNRFCASGIYDLVAARELVQANESLTDAIKGNQTAVLDILRVWAMQIVTDTWVNVPYSEAFNPDEFPNPAYDSQQEIYAGLI
uniref:SusD/RagB family nutrient-binding outer membrane lipoprotein n=1 Tax=Marivirga sp. TaxID=2018662 RepID=UPI0025DC1AD8